jgi:hypothetical protein
VATLQPSALIDLWERAGSMDPVDRALALALAADPDRDEDALMDLPLGRRDELVLRVRRALEGDSLAAVAACPACGERAELVVDAADLCALAEGSPPAAPVEVDGVRAEWRSPTTRDVVAALSSADVSGALLGRCILRIEGPSGEMPVHDIPARLRSEIVDAMSAADPVADLLIEVDCPGCAERFVVDVDVPRFVWDEIDARARRLLKEVDLLARAYGWTEPEVLALSDRRRATYLGLVTESPS